MDEATRQAFLLLSTSEVSDALDACGIEGALCGIKAINTHAKMIGPAYTVQYLPYETPPQSFQNAGNYIDHVPKQSIIVIDNQGKNDCTTWGNILTETALLKNIQGTVVYGAIRDIDYIRQVNYPVYSTSVFMRSGKNRVYKSNEQSSLKIMNIWIHPGDIIFADEQGVLVIQPHLVNQILQKALAIKNTETAILSAVRSGSSLEDARKNYRYDQPWLDNKVN